MSQFVEEIPYPLLDQKPQSMGFSFGEKRRDRDAFEREDLPWNSSWSGSSSRGGWNKQTSSFAQGSTLQQRTSPYASSKSQIGTYGKGTNPGFGKTFTVSKPEQLEYKEGDRVFHIKFGEGTVQAITDGGKDYEVTVDFDRVGVRKLFASFAKLRKV